MAEGPVGQLPPGGCSRRRQTKARREMLDICAVIIQTGHISMGACVEY